MQARHLDYRVFLEGVEIDAASVSLSAGIMTSAKGTVSIPFTDAAHDILPRTLVHIFWAETAYEVQDGKLSGAKKHVDHSDLASWRLIFAGEVISYLFQKVAGQRQIVLQVHDFSSYWNQARVYWGSGKTSYSSYKQAIFMGATQIRRNGKKVRSSRSLAQLLQAKPATWKKLPGILGGVVSLLEATTGVYDRNLSKNFRGVNDHLSQSELRLHLTRMIAASPDDDTSTTFLASRSFRLHLTQLARQFRSTSSYFQLIQMLLQATYQQFSSQLAPPFITGGTVLATKVLVPSGVKYKGSAKASKLYDEIRATQQLVGKAMHDGLIRADNFIKEKANKDVDFMQVNPPSQGGIPKYKTNGMAESVNPARDRQVNFAADLEKPVSAGGGGGFVSRTQADLEVEVVALRQQAKNIKGSPAARKSRIRQAEVFGSGLKHAARALDALHMIANKGKYGDRLDPNDPYRGHNIPNFRDANGELTNALKKMARALKQPFRTIPTELTVNSRLHSFLFCPDLFMVPPPKCNVLTPDCYMSVTFSRTWMSEITRLWLHTRTIYGRPRRDIYFAPNTSILGGPSAATAEEAVKKGSSFIMEHERYTGIIPKIQAIGDKSTFRKVHRRALKELRRKGLSRKQAREKLSGAAAYSPQEYMSRTANYMFFAERMAGRTMRVVCRFAPQLVAGVPILLLDPEENEYGVDRGTHYIGMLASINHVFDASGGAQTIIDMVKCRTHKEGLGLLSTGELGTTLKRHVVYRKKKLKPPLYTRVLGEAPSGSPSVGSVPMTGNYSPFTKARTDKVVRPKVIMAQDQAFAVKIPSDNYTKDGRLAEIGPALHTRRADKVVNFKPNKKKKYIVQLRRDYKSRTYDPTQVSTFANSKDTYFPNTGGYLSFKDLIARPDGKGVEEVSMVYVDVYEITPWKKPEKVSFTFEGSVTPPWFAPIFQAERIGDEFYKPMFGCGSILSSPLGLDKIVERMTDKIEIEVPVSTAQGVVTTRVDVPRGILAPVDTCAKAASRLATLWLALKKADADIDLWHQVYTNRSYASLPDILGNQNPWIVLKTKAGEQITLGDTAITGFHGNAYGKLTNLEDPQGVRLDYKPLYRDGKQGSLRHISGNIDSRKDKYDAVRRYIAELGQRVARTGPAVPPKRPSGGGKAIGSPDGG